MDKFVVRSKRSSISCAASSSIPDESRYVDGDIGVFGEKRARLEVKREEDLINDPALRKSIDEYDSWDRDTVRREYLLRGPCQPLLANFPRNDFGNKSRCFQAEWFNKWEWLEYSVSKDAAFCFWCYLFKGDTGKRFGSDVFVKTGFRNWKKASEKFRDHVGAAGSTHNDARARFFAFKDRALCLTRMESSGNQVLSGAYRTCLAAMVDVVRLLLEQGLAFLAHDEATCSLDRGNFLEFLDWYGSFNIDVGKALKEYVPENHQLGSPSFQSKVISSCALETTKAIIRDIGDKFFSLLIGDDRDISEKEQLTIIRILGLTHVLSQFLQQNDQDIIAAMDLLRSTKGVLQDLKDNGWDELFEDVNSFCTKNDIIILNMEDCAPSCFYFGRTYYDHFRDGIFGQVIDNICHELENRFNEQAIEVLTCISCLDPKNSFSKFNESKLHRLAELYPLDFSSCDQMELMHKLMVWILEMRGNVKFSKLQTIEDLAKKMVEVGYHIAFHLVYRLIELALVLPVVSATMPRTFSSIDAIKTELHSKMRSDFSADCLVCYVEKDVFRSVRNDAILQHFQET
ncbi:hypothetical protein V2J09_023711 [Rumex salicifolius]